MSLPRMSWHIGDYKKDTGHLRAADHGAYFLLIMHYWATGGLPDNDKQLAAIACMSDREWKQHRSIIAALFGPEWTHKRVNEELVAAQLKYEKRSNAGKKGGRPLKQSKSNALTNQKQPITLTDKELDDGGDARGTISRETLALADDLAEISGLGRDPKNLPPGWCGAPMRIQAWIDHGWPRELILVGAREAMARKRDGPPDTVNYFEKPIARTVAQHAKPLPKVVVNNTPEVVHVQADQRHPGGAYGASKDRFREAYAKLSELADGEPTDSEGDQGAVEVLRPVRRERS